LGCIFLGHFYSPDNELKLSDLTLVKQGLELVNNKFYSPDNGYTLTFIVLISTEHDLQWRLYPDLSSAELRSRKIKSSGYG
jgi:hypothetical protein